MGDAEAHVPVNSQMNIECRWNGKPAVLIAIVVVNEVKAVIIADGRFITVGLYELEEA